jgi:alkyl sulfatase BDS1-like metallo-beta-lactamase superfamily hydrolase
MPDIQRKIAGAENVIMESNSVIRFLRPDLYLSVLDADTEDFKDSAREFLDRADAVILHQSNGAARWKAVSTDALKGKPVFKIEPPPYVTEEIVGFVRKKLLANLTADLRGSRG